VERVESGQGVERSAGEPGPDSNCTPQPRSLHAMQLCVASVLTSAGCDQPCGVRAREAVSGDVTCVVCQAGQELLGIAAPADVRTDSFGADGYRRRRSITRLWELGDLPQRVGCLGEGTAGDLDRAVAFLADSHDCSCRTRCEDAVELSAALLQVVGAQRQYETELVAVSSHDTDAGDPRLHREPDDTGKVCTFDGGQGDCDGRCLCTVEDVNSHAAAGHEIPLSTLGVNVNWRLHGAEIPTGYLAKL
jgi:hypothetical protein